MEADHSFTTAACTVYVHISPGSPDSYRDQDLQNVQECDPANCGTGTNQGLIALM